MASDELILERALADDLMPFSLIFGQEGNVTNLSPLLRQVWGIAADEPSESLQGRVELSRPFTGALVPEWLPELTEMIVHLHLSGAPERRVRGQFYPHADGWLFTGFPPVSTITDLERLGIQLSQLPLHIAMGEQLVANETSLASLRESQEQARQIEASNQTLSRLNERFARFVPTAILENIGVRSPLEAELGRQVETNKAVMFADLRQFTTISEQLEANEIFQVINQYLGCTVPCIEEHNGYVIQYLGDGIMALFPGGSADALNGAVAMQHALRNCLVAHSDFPFEIRMSIGIHEGPVALGIVGNETRWDVSIIADAVNTSARIESMTRLLGGEIIVSRPFLDSCGDLKDLPVRNLGAHRLRGREEVLELVEILASLDEEERTSRQLTQTDFAAGLDCFQSGNLYAAMSAFSRVLSMVPTDQAAQYYLARVSEKLLSEPSR